MSDFEGKEISSVFGAGWSLSTDSLIGGKSTARFQLVQNGAQNSKGSLLVAGKIDDKAQSRWGGVSFSPGVAPFVPTNLSSKKVVSFWSKGDGKTYAVMLFFQKLGFRPSIQTFTAGKEWTLHRFALRDFDGCDGSDILAVFFGGGPDAGDFSFQVDTVRFEE